MTKGDEQPPFQCLCCDQLVTEPRRCPDPEKAWELLQALGYTREELLTTHRANLDYTAGGFTDWLRRQP